MNRRDARRIVLQAAAAYLRDADDDLLTTDPSGWPYSDAELARIERERVEIATKLAWRANGLDGREILTGRNRRGRPSAALKAMEDGS